MSYLAYRGRQPAVLKVNNCSEAEVLGYLLMFHFHVIADIHWPFIAS
jgi:hypothetical protein